MRIETAVLIVTIPIALCVSPGSAADPSRRAVSSCTWTEDFQGDSLGQFTSYPPVQDIGYDPSLSPASRFGPPGGRALMRIVKPNRPGPERFGFIRALDLLTSPGGTLTFAYRLDLAKPGDEIEIGIAGSDGHRYASAAAIEYGEQWHTVRMPLARLLDPAGRSAPAYTGIEALFLVANLKHTNPDITYRFLIDDLKLEAARELRFEMRTPHARTIAHWPESFSVASSEAGRPTVVEASAPVPLKSADYLVEDPEGRVTGSQPLYDDATHGDRIAHDGVWSSDAVLGSGQNGSGVLTLHLRGTAKDGRSLSTSLRVLRRSAETPAHPRLYFGPADRARMLARTQDPKYAPIWRRLLEHGRAVRSRRDWSRVPGILSLLDPEYLLPTLPAYFDLVSNAGACVELNALDAYVTGNAESLAAARSTLLAIARWNAWAPPWFHAHGQHTYYPAGELAAQVAFAYDLLYGSLTPEERASVRASLLEYGIARTYREYVADNRLAANTSNWIGHTVGGALVAASAIWGDGPDQELPLYVNGLLRKFEEHLAASYLPDGSYGEGIGYQEFDLKSTGLALTAIERVFGVNDWDRSHVRESLSYPLSTLAQPVSGGRDTGDAHYPSGYSSAPVVARSHDPVMHWYFDHFEHRSLHDFLFADFSIPGQAPPAPGSRYFRDKGNVVFRSGWGADDIILLFRIGPNFNHNHADQGSFLMRAYGENLVSEGGPADYYKELHYDSYFKQAVGHNTVLVDRDPESQEIGDTLRFAALHQYPRFTDVILSAPVALAGGELQQVYRGRLRSYNRRMLIVGQEYVVVCDDLAANGVPAQFDWLLHLPDLGRTRTDGTTSLYAGEKAALAVRALLPADASVRLKGGYIPFSTFTPSVPMTPPPNPAILEVGTSAPAVQTRFLVVLAPARTAQAAGALVSALRPIEDASWQGFESSGESGDLVLFRKRAAGTEMPYAAWATDAAVWMARREGGQDKLLAAQHATTLKHGGRILFASDKAVSFVAENRGGHIVLTVSAPAAVKVKVARPGGELAERNLAAGQQSVTIP